MKDWSNIIGTIVQILPAVITGLTTYWLSKRRSVNEEHKLEINEQTQKLKEWQTLYHEMKRERDKLQVENDNLRKKIDESEVTK